MTNVEAYLDNLTEAQLAEFNRIKSLMLGSVPEAKLKISYEIPTFTYRDAYLIYFGAFAKHYSLYPASDEMIEVIEELSNFRSSKGTLKYTASRPINDELVKQIIQFRKQSIENK